MDKLKDLHRGLGIKEPSTASTAQGQNGLSMSGHQSVRMKSDTWITPQYILAPLGKFDFDPCSIHNHPWPVSAHYSTKDSDGLKATWFGRVWLNPPFGQQVGPWLAKMSEHGNGIALVAARTETRWFFDYIWEQAQAVCFLRSRPHFHFANGERAPFNSGAPIVLVAYGERNARCLRASGLGKTIRLWESPCVLPPRSSYANFGNPEGPFTERGSSAICPSVVEVL